MAKKSTLALSLALLLLAGCTSSPVMPPDQTEDPAANTDVPAVTEPAETKPYAPVEIELPDDPNLLYNGIRLPEQWPPADVSPTVRTEIAVPYLKDADEGGTHPETVDIDVGRQLFVDDFLIEKTTLTATAHDAVEYEGNPVLTYDGMDMRVKNGGLFYDAERGLYELFFIRGNELRYITSTDGITWVPHTATTVLTFTKATGGYASVVRNETPDAANPRYVCLVRYNNASWEKMLGKSKDHEHYHTDIYYSDNGQVWRLLTNEGPTCGDATTMIYNPFRQTYIFSLRRSYKNIDRARDYVECRDILDVADFDAIEPVFWLRTDLLDPRAEQYPHFLTELYSVSSIAYESIMLGAFQIYRGPSNSESNKAGIPKITDIGLGYSRDGFYYSRPFRETILNSSQDTSRWDCGYLHPLNSVCVIVGDELRIYYSAYEGDTSKSGDPDSVQGSMANCGVGFATMRRDGFVSLDGTGEVITRKLRFDEVNDRLFINAKAKSVRAEIRDADGKVISGFSLDECVPFSGDSTCTELTFTSGKNLGELQGRDFSIRFVIEEGEFYAFWVSDTADGESGGFLAAGYDAR